MSDSQDPDPLYLLDRDLRRFWRSGQNLVIGWRPSPGGIEVFGLPHYLVPERLSEFEDSMFHRARLNDASLSVLSRIEEIVRCKLSLSIPAGVDYPSDEVIDSVVKRYGITRLVDKGVALFDVVGFSHYSPLEQASVINSLAHSINAGAQRVASQGMDIEVGQTTTGDGFYVWNRFDGVDANVTLFVLSMMVLADNVLARMTLSPRAIPSLRTCFHLGSCYAFHHAGPDLPGREAFIVGEVTITLARMSESALPGQILVGAFIAGTADSRAQAPGPHYDSLDFFGRVQTALDSMRRVMVGGEDITLIRCYATGDQRPDGSHDIDRYAVVDKHGYNHEVYNAKATIHRERDEAIYLGLRREDLTAFRGVPKSLDRSAETKLDATWPGSASKKKKGKTLLIVEDEPDLRELIVARLGELQHTLLEAETGVDALRVLKKSDRIDLLMTDLVMPGHIDGLLLANRAREIFPEIRVLYTTGYGGLGPGDDDRRVPGSEFLAKPFDLDELAGLVRLLLDR